ncbi:nucleoside 2-deoxyribosyltransferase [Lactobacillus alvi]|uniref:Nucleoside 2-deoxyribosyltransferase n=1 Tax=Limosilactobacillus alvi TaxID=990412 RepID=A0ABS2ELK5_9LACO|nr:nucleoside 2-deoxyribosyltransferase [Limosilactobacillus alvi]MBM6753387.1 nucleoside 2-deoxyribosyltransferase [Limosilactobacillus alvi]
MKIYLAGPFFSTKQITRIEKVEKALTNNQTVTSYFSPRLSDENSQSSAPEGSPAWAKQIFKKDVAEIDKADALVVVADYVHANMDSGTAFEVGYAYNANKPIIILQELTDEPLNLMIGQAAHYYTQNINEIETYDFNQLPANDFTGKTF